MSLRDRDAYARNAWNWGILDGCFGPNPKAGLSDLDGVIERNGHILILEAKSTRNIPRGQERMLEAFGGMPLVEVVMVRGAVNQPKEMRWFIRGQGWTSWEKANLQDLRRECAEWWLRASENRLYA